MHQGSGRVWCHGVKSVKTTTNPKKNKAPSRQKVACRAISGRMGWSLAELALDSFDQGPMDSQ